MMIHAILKKSGGFLLVCFWLCLAAGKTNNVPFHYFLTDGDYPIVDYGAIIFCGLIGILQLHEQKGNNSIGRYLEAICLAILDHLFIPIMLVDLATVISQSTNVGYYALIGWFVYSADTTGNLSHTKVMLLSFFLSPVIALGVLIYNNKHSVEEAEKYMTRAQRAIKDGAYTEAINEATEAIEICSKDKKVNYQLAKCYYWRGKAYRHANEHAKASEDLKKAIELGTGDSFLALANIELTTNYIEQDPTDEDAYQFRAEAYIDSMKANPEEDFSDVAIADFSKLVELDDKNAYAYANRGLLYGEKKGDYEQAITDCTKAIEIASASDDYGNWSIAQAYRTRRKVYLKMGDTEKAEADHAKAHELEEKDEQ